MDPGGYVLIGEGFHASPVPAEYAAFLGTPSGLERSHLENMLAAEAAGFDCVHAITASPAEWDAFEWGFHRRRMVSAAQLSGDEKTGKEADIRRWRDGYLRWGREVMGFGLYLLRAPERASA